MSYFGFPDLDRPIQFEAGTIYHPFGGGAFSLIPHGCSVANLEDGRTNFALDLIRPAAPLPGQEAYALLEMRLDASYAGDKALAYLRAQNPQAVLSQCTLTEWQFRLTPGPATLNMPPELLIPSQLASNGLGAARMVLRLSIEAGLLVESLLRDGSAPLGAVAEAQMMGISPRVGAVVRVNAWDLMAALLDRASPDRFLPWSSLVGILSRERDHLPFEVSGQIGPERAMAFGEALADRVIARFGSYVTSGSETAEPLVALPRLEDVDDIDIRWSLSQPFLAARRVIMPFDLLSDLRQKIATTGIDAFVRKHTAAALPSLGRSPVMVFAHLPIERLGVAALGATLSFPPKPPHRPHGKNITVLLAPPEDLVQTAVELAPGEPLTYDYCTFAVISDEHGVHEVSGPQRSQAGSPLRLSPDDFPLDFILVEATQDLARLASLAAECRYERAGREYTIPFTLDSGRLSLSVAIPKDGEAVRVTCTATDRVGSGRLALGPYESKSIRLDLTSLPEYGWHEADIVCDFSGKASVYAVDVLPAGYPESFENITILAFTHDQPQRRFGWFAASPFMPGFRYRPHRSDDAHGGWRDVPYPVERFVVIPEQVESYRRTEAVALAQTHRRPNRNGHLRPVSETLEASAERFPDGVPLSPQAEPTDTLIYSPPRNPARKLYIPRYHVDVQTVSGQPRYRIAMAQQGPVSTLTVQLVKAPAESLGEEGRHAEEYPHDIVVTLDFLQSPPSGARKSLTFDQITRSGPIVTATMTLATLPERDEVYRALTEADRDAQLLVKRTIEVAIPQAGPSRFNNLLLLKKWSAVTSLQPFNAALQPNVVPLNLMAMRVPLNLAPARLTPGSSERSRFADALASTAALQPNLLTNTMFVPRKPIDSLVIRPIDVLKPVDILVPSLPTPALAFAGTDNSQGNDHVKVNLSITNWQQFSSDFFRPSPDLPPCGKNQNASRTWVDIHDAATDARLYGFCAIGSPSTLAELWFSVPAGQTLPGRVYVKLNDRRTGLVRTSNVVETRSPEPPAPTYQEVVRELDTTVQPKPFAFPPNLHGYIYQGIAPGSTIGGLVRYRLSWKARFHTYLQDSTRPSLVYFFPDAFKIARRSEPPFSPLVTVRVTSRSGTDDADVVFDYSVAPFTDAARLVEARQGLLADPRFGAGEVEFQPFVTSDVRFFLDRPTQQGTVKEERSGVSLVLQSTLKDSLVMKLPDLQILFDALHRDTASLFLGRFEIDVPGENTEVIPFTGRMDDLVGELFLYGATVNSNGSIHVSLTNAIESPLRIDALQATITENGHGSSAVVQGLSLPVSSLASGSTVEMTVVPATPLGGSGAPAVMFALDHVEVLPDPAAIWDSILDRSTLEFFNTVTVKAVPNLFDPIAGRENDQIVAILAEFQSGGTAELNAGQIEAKVRIDYPIDDVILRESIDPTYRYTVTVIRADGRQERDAEPREGSAQVFFVNVQK